MESLALPVFWGVLVLVFSLVEPGDFPTTANAVQPTGAGGGQDAFFAILNTNTNALTFSSGNATPACPSRAIAVVTSTEAEELSPAPSGTSPDRLILKLLTERPSSPRLHNTPAG